MRTPQCRVGKGVEDPRSAVPQNIGTDGFARSREVEGFGPVWVLWIARIDRHFATANYGFLHLVRRAWPRGRSLCASLQLRAGLKIYWPIRSLPKDRRGQRQRKKYQSRFHERLFYGDNDITATVFPSPARAESDPYGSQTMTSRDWQLPLPTAAELHCRVPSAASPPARRASRRNRTFP